MLGANHPEIGIFGPFHLFSLKYPGTKRAINSKKLMALLVERDANS
jgi:hypothetical protein